MICKRALLIITSIILFSFIVPQSAIAQKNGNSFSSLTKNETIDGFKTEAVYLNDENKPMGGRFIHEKSGFTLDLLQIESVPQAFFWVNTFPVSDMGEPHTQEHLLITKGNKGHNLNTVEGMSLARHNAFTSQIYTSYNFYTGADRSTFYKIFGQFLDALLYPDYTNEEVHREVRNWGVSQNPDKSLRIEEKGSVYNEMSTTMNNPFALMFDKMGRLLYGNAHPLSYNAGGLPSGIRELNATEIAKFHDQNYYLGNMGAVISLSKKASLNEVLNKMNSILSKLESESNHKQHVQKTLPPPQPAKEGEIAMVDFPSQNAQQPGSMMMAYPPSLKLSLTENILLNNFLNVFAGDATTNLYKIFVNSETRNKELSAQAVFGYMDNNEGMPVFFGLTGVSADNLNTEKGALARKLIIDELKRVAAFKDNSPELLEFNKRFQNNLISIGRSFANFVNTPPKFGFRNTGGSWYEQLTLLNKSSDFEKPVTLKPEMEAVKKLVSSGKNIWKDYLNKWNLTTATPYVVISKASPELMVQLQNEKKERTANEIASLKNLYHLDNDQDAIRRYKEVYDSSTVAIEKSQNQMTAKFIDNPPLTLDDQLNYSVKKLPGNIPIVTSVFNNMTGATTGIALDLHSVPKDQLVYLAMLPELLTGSGIIKDGKTISYEEMVQMLQKEIFGLNAYYSTNGNTDRAELVVRGAGNNPKEAARAIEWINDVLKSPNWQKENLPRLRDMVEQEFSGILKTMQSPEEAWVNGPSNAYKYQDQPLQLATQSFLTKEFNILRLKWMLKDAGDATTAKAANEFLSSLSNAGSDRAALNKLLALLTSDGNINADSAGVNKQIAIDFINLPASAKSIAKDAATDLQQLLSTLPDVSLDEDWKMLCTTIQKDLAQSPEKTLDDLNSLRQSLLKNGNARMFAIGSETTEQKLQPSIEKLLAGFSDQPVVTQEYSTDMLINERVKQRMKTDKNPVFVGLISPDSPTGVFINSAPLVKYTDTSKSDLEKFLAAELYAGAGKESVYTKSTGAGLSYSTGIGVDPSGGTIRYYAERTPLLPQTLQFVINEIKKSPFDKNMLDYVVSLAVGSFRSANDYEDRGEAMANDLADGLTPEIVKNFRWAILKLRKQPGVIKNIYQYKDKVYETILPGYGEPSKDVKGAQYFVIGPEKQMEAYEAYLKSKEGNDAELFRLYPRDFWMVN